MMTRLIIAIDGTAGSGKGTLAKGLSKHFDIPYLDTGLLYRWLGWKTQGKTPNANDISSLYTCSINEFNTPALRTDQVAMHASKVATIPSVRNALLAYQRDFAEKSAKGCILDGRDIGTRVLPQAPFKFFLSASLATRSLRRYRESTTPTSLAHINADMKKRDEQDITRTCAPLKPAEDAIIINTDDKSIEEVLAEAISFIDI